MVDDDDDTGKNTNVCGAPVLDPNTRGGRWVTNVVHGTQCPSQLQLGGHDMKYNREHPHQHRRKIVEWANHVQEEHNMTSGGGLRGNANTWEPTGQNEGARNPKPQINGDPKCDNTRGDPHQSPTRSAHIKHKTQDKGCKAQRFKASATGWNAP